MTEKKESRKGNTPISMDDCDRPACDDIVTMFQAARERNKAKQKQETTQDQRLQAQCPPRSAELGTSTWTLLHTMTAWYPDEPSEKDRRNMTQFMASFARFYPCTWCADDFQHNLQKRPVKTASRKELCQWLCMQHNLVNEKLGKPLFSCNMKDLDERWRKSSKEQCQRPPGNH